MLKAYGLALVKAHNGKHCQRLMRAQYMALTTYKLSDVWSGIGQAHTGKVHGTDLMEHVYNKEVTSPCFEGSRVEVRFLGHRS